MFTGIINHTGRIESAQMHGDLEIAIHCDWPENSLALGESIACNGACLTVVDKGSSSAGGAFFKVELSRETLGRTAPRWNIGDIVHLERALKLGDTLDGHMVTGHVDGIAIVGSVTQDGDSHVMAIDAPASLARFIAEKGSVTLDGISLTVNKVERSRFWINVIPHTWKVTTLHQRQPGDGLNIEIDLIARYVARLLNP